MKRILTVVSAAAVITTTACSFQKEPIQEQPTQKTESASPFTPTSSGTISATQAKIWSIANNSLDSLITIYDTTVENMPAIPVQEKDVVCRNAGFSGGYSEYQWVSKMITKAVNRPLLDSLQKQTL